MITKEDWHVENGCIKPDDSCIVTESLGLIAQLHNEDDAEFIVSACNQCKEINPEHPELVAQNIKEMYEILKALDNFDSYWWQEVDGDILKRMNKVLSKIKGGE